MWQPYQEPLRTTLLRNTIIALVAGAAFSAWPAARVSWPLACLLMLWPTFGGHLVELWYLNWLRPRLSSARHVQIVLRFATWFVSGIGMAFGMAFTAIAVADVQPARWPRLWLGGFAFIGVELVAHLALQLRGRPSFYNGQG